MVTREQLRKRGDDKAPALDAVMYADKDYCYIKFPRKPRPEVLKLTKPDDSGKGGGNLFITVRPILTDKDLDIAVDYQETAGDGVRSTATERFRITGAGRGNAINLFIERKGE